MSLTSGASGLTKVVASAGGAAASARDALVSDDAHNLVGSVVTSSSRQNIYSSGEWGSSGPWVAYYNNWQDANSRIQGWNMFMGDGYPSGTTNYKFSNDSNSNEHRLIEWGQEKRMGFYYRDRFEYENDTGEYSGCTWRCMPVRNTTSASITRSISTSRTGSGGSYGGHSTIIYTPNSGKYSEVTSGTWTIVNDTSHTSESNYNQTFNVTIPANTTVLIMNTSGWWYHTTYWFKDSNMFYNLHTFFTDDNSLVCDLRMLDAMATIRITGEGHTDSNPWKLYPQCALKHGDR
tara:strand:+ start:302 stop:1174 length:873 start_codon:yes stop_codon:yes gene_type:complete